MYKQLCLRSLRTYVQRKFYVEIQKTSFHKNLESSQAYVLLIKLKNCNARL